MVTAFVRFARGSLAFLVLIGAATLSARGDFLVSDLGALPAAGTSRAFGLNDAGLATGEADTLYGFARAFLGDAQGPLKDLGTLPMGFASRGADINNLGQIVGRSQTFVMGKGYVTHAFQTNGPGSAMKDLGALHGGSFSEARSINDSGQVVGMSRNAAGVSRAVLWRGDGSIHDLGAFTLSGSSEANGINNAGQIVGRAESKAGVARAFRYEMEPGSSEGVMHDLGSLRPGGASDARGINSGGDVTGWSQSVSGANHAFFFSDSLGMIDIHGPGLSGSSYGLGINDLGMVVGRLEQFGQGNRAFLWTKDSGMLDLNTLIDRALGWHLSEATAINTKGQIVGIGSLNGRARGFLLTSTGGIMLQNPEPASIVLAGLGGLMLLAAGARARRGPRPRSG